MSTPIKVVILSHSDDEKMRSDLKKHLAPLVSDNRIAIWDDSDVLAGSDRKAELSKRIESARMILLLISAAYQNSSPCSEEKALAFARREFGVRIIPIQVSHGVIGTEYDALQMLPRNRNPICAWKDHEKAWENVAREIREVTNILIQDNMASPISARRPSMHTASECDSALASGMSGTSGSQRALGSATKLATKTGSSARVEPEQQELSFDKKIDDAKERRRHLADMGLDTVHVSKEIIELQQSRRKEWQLKAGSFLAGTRFLLTKPIGQGGFGTVWMAKDNHNSGNLVAIKVMHHHLAGDLIRRARFFRGGNKMAELKHPAIVPVLTRPTEDEGGAFYFSMMLMDGGNLQEAINNRSLDIDHIITITLRIADCLIATHRMDWVHRDVKPTNILLDKHGNAYLSDFDLILADKETSGGTSPEEAMGSIPFSAPETQDDPSKADARADVFSLGRTLLFCLHGKPFKATTVYGNKWNQLLQRLDCHEALKRVLRESMALKPSDRFDDVRSFRKDLQEAVTDGDAYLRALSTDGRYRFTQSQSEPLIEMIRVPGGCLASTGVRVEPFLVSKVPLSKSTYHKIMDESPPRRDKYLPEELRWIQAILTCNKFSEKEDLTPAYVFDEIGMTVRWDVDSNGYRLPTATEWEFAACGTDMRKYPWGDEPPSSALCCYNGNEGQQKPSPVGQYPDGASPFGILDMAGNVWEWCWDWPRRQESEVSIVMGRASPPNGHKRITRGGDWRTTSPAWLSATYKQEEDVAHSIAGVRLVRSIRHYR